MDKPQIDRKCRNANQEINEKDSAFQEAKESAVFSLCKIAGDNNLMVFHTRPKRVVLAFFASGVVVLSC